jgi:hypothetical protein
MCDPVSMSSAVLAMTAASVAAQVKAQQDQASQQSQANEKQYQNTMLTYANNNTQVNLQEQQLRAQAAEKMNQNNLQAQVATGKSAAIAGASGAGGNSTNAALGAITGTQDRYNNSVLANYDSGIASSEVSRQNVYGSAASTINGLKTPVLPDYMSAGLRIAQAGYDYSNPRMPTSDRPVFVPSIKKTNIDEPTSYFTD